MKASLRCRRSSVKETIVTPMSRTLRRRALVSVSVPVEGNAVIGAAVHPFGADDPFQFPQPPFQFRPFPPDAQPVRGIILAFDEQRRASIRCT